MAPGGFLPRWQSLTQWLSAVWRLLWWLRQQTTRKVWRPPAASETLLGGRAPTTKRVYERAYDAFHPWAARNGRPLESPADYDAALWDFAKGLTKSRVELTLAALERLLPPLKRQMPWSKALISAIAVQHTLETASCETPSALFTILQ